ncbi:MAG: hypothetical protein CSA11_09655 [Chloroflexi bacterium]|nr:MAG: hypothetical protein CSA11_09655 [Chloroflexota bacterium]
MNARQKLRSSLKTPIFWMLLLGGVLFLLVRSGYWRSTSAGAQVQVPMFYDAHYLYPRPWTQAQEAPGVPQPFPVAFFAENSVTQPFVSGADNLSQVEVWLRGSPYGVVDVVLSDETGSLYVGYQVFPEDPRGGYVRFEFPTIAEAEGKTFWFTLSAPHVPIAEPAITRTLGGDRLGGAVQLNEFHRPGNLDLRTYVTGTAVFDALLEQLLPDLFRLRLQQYKPFKGETFAILLLVMVSLSVVYLILARPFGQRLGQAVLWTLVGLLAGLLGWQIGGGRVQIPGINGAVTLQPPAVVESSDATWGEGERLVHDLSLLLWTADRQPEERFIDTTIVADYPAIVVPAESEIGYALDVPQNGRLRVGAQVKEPGQLQYTIYFDETELATQFVDTETVWFDVDLTPFAGQGGTLRLVTEAVRAQPQGYWFQPQIFAQTDWLLPQLPTTAQAAGHQFGDAVRLLGFSLEPTAENQVEVSLYWQTERPLRQNAVVFVHLLDETGEVVTQHDGQPVQNSYPLSIWPTHHIIADRHPLTLPAGSSWQDYQMAVGLYHPSDFTRWPVTNPEGILNPDSRALLSLEPIP